MPRHDTSLRLPAEAPREALARDEALLDEVRPGGPWSTRLYLPSARAVVVGLGLWHRVHEVIDLARCAAAGVDVFQRRAGGGAVLVDANMVCGAICAPLPQARIGEDVTESYRWLGEYLARALAGPGVRRIEVAEARADVERLRSEDDALSRLLLTTCYGALSPHEIVAGHQKLVGLAQVRRRYAVLFQFGILLKDQAPLVDFLNIQDEELREELRGALKERTGGLLDLQANVPMAKIAGLSTSAAAWAASGATPCAR